jgi:ABC-type antimicrobial peptide transport system permease subunit
MGTFSGSVSYLKLEEVMRAYLKNLTPKAGMLLAVPIVAIAYPVIMILLPAIARALVPDVVRSVLSLI